MERKLINAPCVRCFMLEDKHLKGKCLFLSTQYRALTPMEYEHVCGRYMLAVADYDERWFSDTRFPGQEPTPFLGEHWYLKFWTAGNPSLYGSIRVDWFRDYFLVSR